MYSVRVMISLFTRAMISSTTASAGERDGSNSAYPTANSRGSLVFFIRALSKSGYTQGNCCSILRREERGGQCSQAGVVGQFHNMAGEKHEPPRARKLFVSSVSFVSLRGLGG